MDATCVVSLAVSIVVVPFGRKCRITRLKVAGISIVAVSDWRVNASKGLLLDRNLLGSSGNAASPLHEEIALSRYTWRRGPSTVKVVSTRWRRASRRPDQRVLD